MSEKREDQRPENEKLWDKTFEDNQDADSQGHFSRMERRKQTSHDSRITTILIILIIILAAAPVIYWTRHKQSFDHPVRQERVASTKKKAHSKKSANSKKTSHKKSHKRSKSSESTSNVAESVSSQSSVSSANSYNNEGSQQTQSSQSSSSERYATVQSGQGIYRVAANHGMTVDELARLNGISPNTALKPGQQLKVK